MLRGWVLSPEGWLYEQEQFGVYRSAVDQAVLEEKTLPWSGAWVLETTQLEHFCLFLSSRPQMSSYTCLSNNLPLVPLFLFMTVVHFSSQ